MDNEQRKTLKATYLKNLAAALGIIYIACEQTGVSRETIRVWRKNDTEFDRQCRDVGEMQIDWAEGKLFDLISKGNATATIFYLKTRGKARGYSESCPHRKPDDEQQKALGTDQAQELQHRIADRVQRLTRTLGDQGKYSQELDAQILLTAKLLVRTDLMFSEITSAGYSPVNTEYSREGNARESANPREKLYLDLTAQSQKALKALGLNTDAKERATAEETPIDTMLDTLNQPCAPQ